MLHGNKIINTKSKKEKILLQLPSILQKGSQVGLEKSVCNDLRCSRWTISMERCLILLHWIFKIIFLYRMENVNITSSLINFQLFKQMSIILCFPPNISSKIANL